MDNFHFVFDAPPPRPSASSPLADVFAWAVWSAMALGRRELVFEETDAGLMVACYFSRNRRPGEAESYEAIARFPHLRGAPLRSLPAKGSGTALANDTRWKVRFWTGLKGAEDTAATCTVVQLLPNALV